MRTKRGLLLLIATLFVWVSLVPFGVAQTTTDQTTMEPAPSEQTTTEQTTTEQTTTYFEEDGDDKRDDALACGVCGGVFLGLPLLGLLISVGIAWWIYRDAQRRGNPQAVLWAVLGFFFNILGLIIYLIARPKGPPMASPPPTV